MSYTLTTSLRSPFGRICRLFMLKHQIPHKIRFLNFVDNKEEAATLAKETPINKVPILDLGNGRLLFDSRIIVNYLGRQHGIQPLSVEEENLVSTIYSCLDVSVALYLMFGSGYDISLNNSYLNRQRDRIPNNLEFIKPWFTKLEPQNPHHWNLASMSLYSFAYYADFRGTIKLQEYPQLQEFLTKFAETPGISETGF